jgi:hypothetical protein
MLDEERVTILRAIGSSIAFDDDGKGKVTDLVLEGYVVKDGDLYELTPKGFMVLEERGCIVGKDPYKKIPRAAKLPSAVAATAADQAQHATWRDVIVELTRAAPFAMLGAAFIAGAILARRRGD